MVKKKEISKEEVDKSQSDMEKSKKERLKKLNNISNKINDKLKKQVVIKASEVKNCKIKTDIPWLDYLTNGGLPRGAFSHIWSKSKAGKSSLCYRIIANAQKQGYLCAYLDFEHTYDKIYGESFGIQSDELFFSQPTSLEEGLNILRALGNDVDIIFIDSIAALSCIDEVEKDMDEASKVASKALKLTSFFEKQTGFLDPQFGASIILVNQSRTDINMKNPKLSGNDKYSGGNMLQHALSFSIHLRRLSINEAPTTIDANGKEVQNGYRIEVKVDKTKLSGNEGETICYDLLKSYPHFDELAELVSLADSKSLLNKKGAWLTYLSEDLKFNGIEAFKKELRVNTELYSIFKKHVMENIKPEDVSNIKLISKTENTTVEPEINEIEIDEKNIL